jgi:hypothetical protein
MRRLFALVMLALACDPGVQEHFTARAPAYYHPDSTRALTLAFVARLANRHQLRLASVGSCEVSYSRNYDLDPRPNMIHNVDLILCLSTDRSGAIDIALSESITRRWGPIGDSLRQELRDSVAKLFVKLGRQG